MNRLGLSLLVVVVALISSFSISAHAEYDSPAWIGGMYGLSVPSASHTNSRGMYGLTAGAKLGSEYGIGVYYLNSHNKESAGDFNYDLYGVEFGYHFEGEAKGAYFGGRLGTSKLKVTSGGFTSSTSPFHYGVFAGYNYFVGDHFSLGGEAGFMSVASSTDTNTIDGFTMLNFLLTAKFWL